MSVRSCAICKDLPLGPYPILQGSEQTKILIAGQAPGKITHNKSVPFDDPSGKRLRTWMGVTNDTLYDPDKITILPMGFCFPGTGKNGDLPPRSECAEVWHEQIMACLSNTKMTLIIGQYAINWHVNDGRKITLTARAKEWESTIPKSLVLPHPSPRNNSWLKTNPWFELEVVPKIQKKIKELLR